MNNLPPISQLFKESLYNFKNNFVSILLTQLPIIGIILFIFGLSIIFILDNTFELFLDKPKIKFFLSFLVFILLTLLGFFLYLVSIIRLESKELSLLEVYKNSVKKILPFSFTMILSTLIVIIGLLLFVIPGIIFLIRFYFVQFIASLEGIYYKSALRKSSEYVKGLWWKVFLRIVALIAFIFLIYFIFDFLSIVASLSSIISISLSYIISIFYIFLSILFNYSINIFSIVYMYTLYKQIKNIKEKPSLD